LILIADTLQSKQHISHEREGLLMKIASFCVLVGRAQFR